MVRVKLKLHQSLWQKEEPHEFTGDLIGLTIIEAMRELLKDHKNLFNLCLTPEGKRKPGILYISGKIELSSLGLLESELDEDLEIRVVPILHGG